MKKAILITLIIITASFSLIGDDFLKFLFTGQSATENIILVRHSYFVVYGIAIAAILCTVFLGNTKWNRFILIVSLMALILSLRTFALETNQKNAVVISGFAVFPISRCEITETHNCKVIFSFFLEGKIKGAMELKANRKKGTPTKPLL